MKETKTVFVIKYWQTKGIQEIPVTINPGFPDTVSDVRPGYMLNYHKGDWFLDKEEAILSVKAKRLKKMSSLKKQIEKLEKMKL